MARNSPEKIEPDTYLSSHEVGAMLQCNPSSVNKWVKEGKIIAHKTPGGHRRMRAADVIAFLAQYNMSIPPQLKSAHTMELDAAIEVLRTKRPPDPLEVALKSKTAPKAPPKRARR